MIQIISSSLYRKLSTVGLIGLLLAAILAASMSSTSAELNSLASTSLIDIYNE